MSAPATEYAEVAKGIAALIEGSADPERAAYSCARLGLFALMYHRGVMGAAETAYRLADEMADATRSG